MTAKHAILALSVSSICLVLLTFFAVRVRDLGKLDRSSLFLFDRSIIRLVFHKNLGIITNSFTLGFTPQVFCDSRWHRWGIFISRSVEITFEYSFRIISTENWRQHVACEVSIREPRNIYHREQKRCKLRIG